MEENHLKVHYNFNKNNYSKKQVKLFFVLLLTIFSFFCSNPSHAQTDTAFWFAVPYVTPRHVPNSGGVIRVTTLDRPSEVTVTRPTSNTVLFNEVIPANQTRSFVLPVSYVQGNLTNRFWDRVDSSSLFIRSRSLDPDDIAPDIKAYYEIAKVDDSDTTFDNNDNNNPDIFSLKGNNGLGYEFYTPFQTRWDNQDYNSPDGAYSSIVIVATEDNTEIRINSPYPIAQEAGGGNYAPNTNIDIILDRGETYKVTPQRKGIGNDVISVDADHRLRGTHVQVLNDKPISVTIGDDSGKKNGPYDYIGDQLVPLTNIEGDPVVGHKYIVLRGQVEDDAGSERFFILGTQNGTNVDVTIHNVGVSNITLDAGQQQPFEMPDAPPGDPRAEYAYIEADAPVYVLHVSGFGDELGGAVIPTIDGCTGSLETSFVRSKADADGDRFYLNLMTKKEGINNFHVETDDGNNTYDLNGSDFSQIPGTDFYYLDQADENRFVDAEITPNTVTRVYNDSAFFHLGMINGRQSGGGCMYGYFSNYIDDSTGAIILSSGSNLSSGCYGDTIQLRAKGGLSYHWEPSTYLDFPDSSKPKAFLPPGIYKFSVEIYNPCIGLDTQYVTVEIFPEVDAFFETSSAIGCAPFDVEFRNKSTGSTDYRWDFENDRTFDYTTDSDSNYVHTYRNQTNSDSIYTVRLVALHDTTPCIDEYERTVRILPEINAGFDQTVDIGCNPLEVTLTDTSSGNTDPNGYEWHLGDGSSSASDTTIDHSFINDRNNDTTYTVELVTTSPYLCKDTATKDITVHSYIDARFTIDTVKGCSPFPVVITNKSKGGVDSCYWDFNGDGINDDTTYTKIATYSPTYTNTGNSVDTIDIRLVVDNTNCTDTLIRTIYVYPEVTASYTQSPDDGCNPLFVQFTNTSEYTGVPGDTSGLVYDWDFDDGATSDEFSPDHLFSHVSPATENYNVSLITTTPQGCSDTATSTVDVYSYIKADFKVDSANGCAPFTITVENTSLGGAGIDSTLWDFQSDGTTDSIISDATWTKTFYNNDGTTDYYPIQLVVKNDNGCTDTITRNITIYSSVTADFDPIDTVGCNTLEVNFRDNSSWWVADYNWDFDDGATSVQTNPTHDFVNVNATDTIYNVELEVETAEGCLDTATTTVTVRPYIDAIFTIDDATGCSPHTVTVSNASQGGISNYYWFWDFNEGDALGSADVTVANPGSHNYINTSGSPRIDTLTLIVSNGSCFDTLKRPVTVYSSVTADFIPTNATGCNPLDVNFSNQSDAWATVYTWDFDDGSTSPNENPSHTFSHTGSSNAVYDVNLAVETANGCTHDTTFPVTVYPYIHADFKINKNNGCSPLTINITNNSEGGISNYYWFWDFSEGDALGSADATGASPGSHTYYNSSGSNRIDSLTLIVSNGNCYDTLKRAITIYSSVTADFIPENATDCNPYDVSFTNQSDPWATVFSWDFDDGGTSTLEDPSHTFSHVSSGNSIFDVNLAVETVNGCSHDTTFPVTVYPYIHADFKIDQNKGCSPLTISIDNDSEGGISNYYWFWDFNEGDALGSADATGSAPGSTIYTNTSGSDRIDTLTLIVSNGNCYDTLKRPITVYSSVTADFIPTNATGCNPLDVTFTNQSDSWANTFAWDFDDGGTSTLEDPSHTFSHTGSGNAIFDVNLAVETVNGCAHDTTFPVTVYPYIKADFKIDKNKGCSDLTINITDNSIGGISDYYWFWDFNPATDGLGDANSNNPGLSSHTYTNTSGSTVTRNLTLIVSNGNCYDTLSRTVQVYSSINAQFSPDVTEGCNPLTVQFNNTTVNATSAWSWDFGDGGTSNQEDPSHEFVNTSYNDTTFTVEFTATNSQGCSDVATRTITVYSFVRADFSITDAEGCPTFTTTIENTSFGNANDTYQWNIDGNPVAGAPTNKADFTHDYANTNQTNRIYDVQLVATNPQGCTSTKNDDVTVYGDVVVNFAMDTNGGCNPLTIDFTDNSAVPANSVYSWSFGDGAASQATDPTHTFFNYDRENDQPYTINLEVISPNKCSDSESQNITVYHQPKAKFDIDKTASCPPLEPTMINESVGEDYFEWRFGDGNINNTDQTVTHSYGNTDNDVKPYSLQLFTQTNEGCKDSTFLTLNVYPEVIADFSYDSAGCAPLVAEFHDSSLNEDFYFWDFGDGNTSGQENPIHRFVNTNPYDTTYRVTLRSYSAFECWDTITKNVRVYAQPDAEFNAYPYLQTFPENRVFIVNNSNQGPWSYQWNFDDGNASTDRAPNFHDYEHWGEYDINLSISSTTSHCFDSITHSVEILPPTIDASFAMSRKNGCEPLEIDFTGAESVFNEAYTYEWDFGDGTTGQGREPTHIYDSAGTYYIKMTAKGQGGSDFAFDTVTVYEVPEVAFEVEPRMVYVGEQQIHCYNFSKYGDFYAWSFGDGDSSELKSPNHLYTELGEYDVSLTVTSQYGCVDSLRKELYVDVRGKGFIEFPNAFTPSYSGPSGGRWEPGSEIDLKNDIFHPIGDGIIEYKLMIFNKWGEQLFESNDFYVGWDGYYQGELMPQDVYVWKVQVKFSDGSSEERIGDVTLIR